MSAATDREVRVADHDAGQGHRRRSRRWWLMVLVVLVLVGGVVAVVLGGVVGRFGLAGSGSGSGGSGSATSLAAVQRRSLSQRMQVAGTLGFAGSYTVLGRGQGTVTWLPSPGRVVGQGRVLYRVDGAPVVLLYGSTPAYRGLGQGATAAEVSGADVAQLNRDLVALGYVQKSDVDSAWDQFGWATRVGVTKLQKHLGADQSGKLDLGQVVFLPTAARVTSVQATLGGPATGAVLAATSTARQVSVDLDADLQSQVHQGDTVTITLPDGSTTPGTVSSVGTVATVASDNSGGSGGPGGSGGGPTVPVHIRPTDARATGGLDQAPVVVAITDQRVDDVLAVPVTALLARSGGGYAVEVVDGGGAHRLVPVSPGLFDDVAGLVQVAGSGLAVGQRVVVPGS